MKLSLSAAAAPALELDALDIACRARGLDGIELVVETADYIQSLAARVRAARARVVALRAERVEDCAGLLAYLSGELGVPLSIPLDAVTGGVLPNLAQVFADAGGTLLLGFATDLKQVVAVTAALESAGNPPCVGLAWELRPSSEDLGASGAVLLAASEHLRLVRLYGGGPEQHQQDGRGIGPLFVDLAISGYGGPIVLTPSTPTELPRWREWLASRQSTGCGSAHSSGEHEVDVRDVEPRDRLGTILGAFRALPRGATMRITLDHDPSCMYYALEESEPAGTFSFRKIGDGPEVWGAEVTKT
ncbi:MAG: DUF2249 domain-containing protein [Myxococcales bacterium]|nr:DUF2249 domain-containing protein [Myxococcales bacterium]MCB9576625.1 DUF2249 domain-containing protein [Polyangiaceae bacterium]